jgi:hypothetical protein
MTSVKNRNLKIGSVSKNGATGQVHDPSSIPRRSSHWQMTGGHWHNIFSSYQVLRRIGAWLCIPDGIPQNSGFFPIPDPFLTQLFPILIPVPIGKVVPANF